MSNRKKKQKIAVAFILAAVLLLVGLVWGLVQRYRSVGLALIGEMEGEYEFNGKLLIPSEGDAKHYDSLLRTIYEDVPLTALDLSPFGFEGKEFRYYSLNYRVDSADVNRKKETVLIWADGDNEGFWPVSKPTRFVYLAEDGRKYCIHPKEGLCYPMFADSVEGVDPYGQDVVGFSSAAGYAVGVEGMNVRIYQTDPSDDSLRVVKVQTVSFAEYGTELKFGAFLGSARAYFTVKNAAGQEVQYALDCPTGTVAKGKLELSASYSDPIGRFFYQETDAKTEKGERVIRWWHRLLGTAAEAEIPEGFSDLSLFAVSPGGAYAVGRGEGPAGEEILVLNSKRAFSLSAMLPEGETVTGVDFVYENILAVHGKDSEGNARIRTYKICF